MTKDFDQFYESVINEFTTAKSKRHASRYWTGNPAMSTKVRKVRTMNDKSASQRTKLGNQQYVGSIFDKDGARVRNKSEKNHAEAGIARGLGNHIKIQGVNPKQPGAKVNSKQGDMEVKYTLDNGISKVGSTGKTDYKTLDPRYYK